MSVIDATNLIMGRMAAVVAKRSLLGEKIDIVNCEKAVITGNKQDIFSKYRKKREIGTPKKGPFIHRSSDKIVRRAVRGMLPYKRKRGSMAYRRIMCHVGLPPELEKEPRETIESVNISKLKILKFIRVEDLSKFMRGK